MISDFVLSAMQIQPFIASKNGKIVGKPTMVFKGESEYRKYEVLCPLAQSKKIIQFIKVLMWTLLSGFFALFSKNVRALWNEVMNGKMVTIFASKSVKID